MLSPLFGAGGALVGPRSDSPGDSVPVGFRLDLQGAQKESEKREN